MAKEMLVRTEEPEGDIEFERDAIDRAFRQGWTSPEDGKPRVLTERAYAEVRGILDYGGGWTGLDQATVQVSSGRPGETRPCALGPGWALTASALVAIREVGFGPRPASSAGRVLRRLPPRRAGRRCSRGLDLDLISARIW